MNFKKIKLVSKVLMLMFISIIALTGCKKNSGDETPDNPNNETPSGNEQVQVQTTMETYLLDGLMTMFQLMEPQLLCTFSTVMEPGKEDTSEEKTLLIQQ